MISYRVPKVKPLKVLGRGKWEVVFFQLIVFMMGEFKNLKGLLYPLFSVGSQRNNATPRDWICGSSIYYWLLGNAR